MEKVNDLVVAWHKEKFAPLVTAFFSGKNWRTIQAYRQDLESFRWFLGAESINQATAILLGQSLGGANAIALGYKASLIERKLQAATVNRRLASLRSLVKLARTIGLVSWSLEVENIKVLGYRNTRGPGLSGYCCLLDEASKQPSIRATRDCAILHLLYDLALRRDSVVTLNMEHVDLEAGSITVLTKGRTSREARTLPPETKAALEKWIAFRGGGPGPLFFNFDRAKKGNGRLSGTSIYRIVHQLGRRAGFSSRPHGLRHAAITEALNLTNGDVRAVARFSGHTKIEALIIYDDNRKDIAGEVARLVASAAATTKLLCQ